MTPLRKRDYFWGYIFILPLVVLFIVFTLYPLLSSIRYTFYDWNGIGSPEDFVFFKHYIAIASDPLFWNAFKNTFFYTIFVAPLQLTFALILAVMLNSGWLKGKSFFTGVFFLPVVTSTSVVGILISLLINSAGHDINSFLINLGFLQRPIDWLGNPNTAIWIIIIVGIWIGLGYPLIYFLAALRSIDDQLYEAAKVDGAGVIAQFWHITVPQIRPVAFIVLLMNIVHCLGVFDLVLVMTKGGPYFTTDVVRTYIYRQAFGISATGEATYRLGFASAAALFMGILVIGFTALQFLAVRNIAQQRTKGWWKISE